MTHPPVDLAERYGAPSRSRRPLVIALVCLLVTAGLGWVLWVSMLHSRPEVTSQLVGYHVRDQHAARATFTVVRRDSDVRASCLLRAFASDHTVVGELTVTVAYGPTETRMTSTVRTEREATNVDLVGCRTGDQPRQR